MSTKILLNTIGYYHRDKDMNTTPDLYPKKLNACKSFLENSVYSFPNDWNLNIGVPSPEKLELKMESLLDYIRQKGWTNGVKPDFVTNRNLLASIASSKEINLVHAFRMNGVTFLMRADKVSEERPSHYKYGTVFEYYATRETKNEKIGDDETVRKAVFQATIPISAKCSCSVLYSAEIDAIDDKNKTHYELKTVSGGLANMHFWRESCWLYWQSIFGMVPTLIIGSRTGDRPYTVKPSYQPGQKFLSKTYPAYSIYKIEKFERNEIPEKVAKLARFPQTSENEKLKKWTVEEGKTRLRNFFKRVQDTVKADGDCFVFSRTDENSEWTIKKDENAVAEFRKVVLQNIPA